jgi:hypothetical protein
VKKYRVEKDCPQCDGALFVQSGGDLSCEDCYLSGPNAVLRRLRMLVRDGRLKRQMDRLSRVVGGQSFYTSIRKVAVKERREREKAKRRDGGE